VPAKGDLANVLCALLLSSREALSMLRLAQSTNTTPKEVAVALEELRETLTASGLPLEVNIAGEQVRLLTTPEVFGYLRNLRNVKKQEKLSAAALETLAVVAYRQPVMRAEIEAIRGVKAGPILRTLLEHRMIKVTGRADVPGRPLQYGTTQHFLETFGLESVKDLPSVKEFRSL
jgi:segregation and condensation protein B